MNKKVLLWSLLSLFFFNNLLGQEINNKLNSNLLFKGQLSVWTHYNENNILPSWSGGRYLPQLNYKVNLPKKNRLFDFEASANIYGNIGFDFQDSINTNGDIKPYRCWVRYAAQQFEFRLGLQKINFGSASLLRPLMWFDQIDPRDPLQLTDGVWGALMRYYFLNNSNIWLWTLYGNENTKGWEVVKSNKTIPEFGGRFQTPLPKGEIGVSFHNRHADSQEYILPEYQYEFIPEQRIGLDAKFDLVVGLWCEASWVTKRKDMGILTNQEVLNIGMDYTFGVGNGLSVIFEQLLASYDNTAFEFDNTLTFSMINMSYHLGIFDNINAIIYYDWTNKSVYNFVNWQKQFNNISLFLMGYANPKDYKIPAQGAAENLYGGVGVQLMFVYNH